MNNVRSVGCRRTIDSREQVTLVGGTAGCRKYGVVATYVADNLGPGATIERERNPLRRADRGFDDKQIGAGRFYRS